MDILLFFRIRFLSYAFPGHRNETDGQDIHCFNFSAPLHDLFQFLKGSPYHGMTIRPPSSTAATKLPRDMIRGGRNHNPLKRSGFGPPLVTVPRLDSDISIS